ncbi:MAG: hypothetical protein A2Y33_00810 [Spirochaetes bacterium GWF1_51_8]|nr:MAG: hypothetical protein A2Y33_00810 [Spirochaetes bacterium GWF1_51_8]
MKFEIADIKDSADFLNVLLNNLTSAVFVVDSEARIINVNDTAEALFSRKAQDFIGKFCGNGIKCMYVEETGAICGTTEYCSECILRAGIMETLKIKRPILKRKLVRGFYIDGVKVEKHLLFSVKPVRYNEKDMVLLIIDDVSELEAQRLKLEEINHTKNLFLGVAAHDLRNPISAINIYASFLKEDLHDCINEEHREFLDSIISSTRFMNHLIKDLLTVSQIESGALNLEIDRNNYEKLLAHCVKINQPIAGKKGIKIESKIEGTIPLFYFDKYKIEQVLNNLIGNAIKFSAGETTITLDISVTGDSVMTSVNDQGPGIPAEEIPRLFEVFRQGSNKPTGDEESTGLGLLISRKIVEGHHGSIGVESIVGKGSSFYFSLPLSIE